MSNYYVNSSKIHGKGIFSSRGFAAGEVIGQLLTPIWAANRQPDRMYGTSNVSSKLGTLVEKSLLERYLNHSSQPNAVLFRDGMSLWLRATKNISMGEEVTVDYTDAFPKIDQLQEDFVKSQALR